MYAKADTSSFIIGNSRFHVAVRSEKGNGNNTAAKLMPAVKRVMSELNTHSGLTTQDPYHFLFYYVDGSRLKGALSTLGMGSALEHKQSSVYYYGDHAYNDTTFRHLDHIISHEYFHTITPLNLHSEKIRDFKFAEPDMSRHLWLYEGVTDYFSALLNEQSELLVNSLVTSLSYSIAFAEKRKPRSMTKSSTHILSDNIFTFIPKIMQLSNFYERGKMLAFGIDMELIKRSNGEKRLLDVMLQMKNDFVDQPFDDETFLDVLTDYTNPDMREYFRTYIEGDALIPYQEYFDMLGWTYVKEGTVVPAYAKKITRRYNFDNNLYVVEKIKKPILDIRKGDYLAGINGEKATLDNVTENKEIMRWLLWPNPDEEITLEILRNGEEKTVKGKPTTTRKTKYSRGSVNKTATKEQQQFRDWLIEGK